MTSFRILCLLFSAMLLAGCSSDYKALRSAVVDKECVRKLKPKPIFTSWYKTSIDVAGKHVSGLLLIKNMPDSSTRIVFTNEAGFKFFDFGFKGADGFKVYYVIDQLNRKPVIRLLQKDFSLLLGVPFQSGPWVAWQDEERILYGVQQKKEKHYFITGKDCASLQRIESGSKRKKMITLVYFGNNQQEPDSIQLQHHTFNMQIRLRKLASN
jgi:hypothetical protein